MENKSRVRYAQEVKIIYKYFRNAIIQMTWEENGPAGLEEIQI